MRFDFVINSKVHHLKSINSKNGHFNLFACQYMNMSHIRMSSPEGSPKTDGIRIGRSSDIKIRRTVIRTSDDCISMISGCRNIDISKVSCGRGNGFSDGSLGKGCFSEDQVTGISMRNCSLKGTQNWLRIKTWAPSDSTLPSNFLFENVKMDNVNNAIIIDQQYCPQATGDSQAQSKVQISNVNRMQRTRAL